MPGFMNKIFVLQGAINVTGTKTYITVCVAMQISVT
jgi:hypothetical protein